MRPNSLATLLATKVDSGSGLVVSKPKRFVNVDQLRTKQAIYGAWHGTSKAV